VCERESDRTDLDQTLTGRGKALGRGDRERRVALRIPARSFRSEGVVLQGVQG